MDQAEAAQLIQRGIDHQQAGRLDEARRDYERILDEFPTFPHAAHLLGVVAGQQGDWPLARRLIESSLLRHPADADALANLAWVLFHLGLHEQVLQRCEAALELETRHARAWFTRGLAMHQLRRFEEAVNAYSTALVIQPRMAEALNHRGRSLHVLERYDEALESYDAALALHPTFADVYNNRASALTMLGRRDEALANYEKSLQLDPHSPDTWFNYGLGLQVADRFGDALQAYEASLRLNPANPDALLYRANMEQKLGRLPQVPLASLDRALTFRPDFYEAIVARASFLRQLDQNPEALDDYDHAIALRPESAEAHHCRGEVLRELGRLQEAARAYRTAIGLADDAHGSVFRLAALGEAEAPPIAPAEFVVNLFDRYAKTFDHHLVNVLEYRSHELLCTEMLKLAPAGAYDIADLGCGTGLCGPLLAPVARRLVGVDLAPKMLDVARERGIYAELLQDDVATFLKKSAAGSFDMLVSADVFVYIGDLTEVFAGARHAIRPGGWFGFSIEPSDGPDFVLHSNRRYSQSLPYIRRLAAAHGFELLVEHACTLRKENLVDTPGYIIVLRAA